ncbi:MFS transporter [Breoghania sp.]|uniref:MFS transporter n=1 Tax=Breoghania sp. TaxID=2065378 RepID=UPI0026299AC9|nr:MFS transporter [Breoghania sp.]MDJ0930638.1 MFS transporter [Breoghania sp.]
MALYNSYAYAEASGVGAAAISIAFAFYVVELMSTLMLVDGLSDRGCRRLPLVGTLVLSVLATGLIAVFLGWSTLVSARLMLGIGTARVMAAGIAYMSKILGEKNTRRAALLVTSATSLGFGAGALVLLGTAVTSAASYGFTYLSVLSEFSMRAPENRARATDRLFVYAYVGISIPVIISGFLSDRFGLIPAMTIFWIALMVMTLATSFYARAHKVMIVVLSCPLLPLLITADAKALSMSAALQLRQLSSVAPICAAVRV